MSIYKKIDNKNTKIADNGIIDHSQLSGRDAFGAHPISAIRKLPEKLTEIKNKGKENADKIAEVETKAKGISLKEDSTRPGKLLFKDYDGVETPVQGGFLPDEKSIILSDPDKRLIAKGLETTNGFISGDTIKSIVTAKGGYLDSNNFGTLTPSQDDLVNYAIQDISSNDVYTYLGILTEEEFNSYRYLYIYENEEYSRVTIYNALLEYYTLNIWDKTRVINLYTTNSHKSPDTWSWDINSQTWSNLGNISIISDANNTGLHGLVTGAPNDGDHDYMGNIDANGHIKINQLPELAQQVNTNENKLNNLLVNEYYNNTDKTYNSQYINNNFAPLSFVSKLYFELDSGINLALVNNQPIVDPNNYLDIVFANTPTDFNWNSPIFTTTRTLQAKTTLNKENSFTVNLLFKTNRNANIAFGAKIKTSKDNGTTWTYISTNQSYAFNDYTSTDLSSAHFIVYTDALTSDTIYDIGDLLVIEYFIKSDLTDALTTTLICGQEIDGSNVYSYLQFNYQSVVIDTDQIADNSITTSKIQDTAVTIDKLSSTLQTKINGIEDGAQVNAIQSISARGTIIQPDANKNVNIPGAAYGVLGLVKTNRFDGIESAYNDVGYIRLAPAENGWIDNKGSQYPNAPITTSNYTYAVSKTYLQGNSAPTTSTAADFVGQLYQATIGGTTTTYQCIAIIAQGTQPETYIYNWEKILMNADFGITRLD